MEYHFQWILRYNSKNCTFYIVSATTNQRMTRILLSITTSTTCWGWCASCSAICLTSDFHNVSRNNVSGSDSLDALLVLSVHLAHLWLVLLQSLNGILCITLLENTATWKVSMSFFQLLIWKLRLLMEKSLPVALMWRQRQQRWGERKQQIQYYRTWGVAKPDSSVWDMDIFSSYLEGGNGKEFTSVQYSWKQSKTSKPTYTEQLLLLDSHHSCEHLNVIIQISYHRASRTKK